MTMPHLMNCPHSADSWCLDCVKELQDKYESSRSELFERNCQYIEMGLIAWAADEWHEGRITDAQLHEQISVKNRRKDAKFVEHLRLASKIVAGWPSWKQRLLG